MSELTRTDALIEIEALTGAKGITVMIRCCFMYYPPCSGLKLQEDSTAVSLPARCVRQGY